MYNLLAYMSVCHAHLGACMICLHVCLCTMRMLGALKARRGCGLPWDRSYRWL